MIKHADRIRNFAIVAHIDHGKSTLADRLLEITGTIDPRHMMDQVLDSNPIERERGITIKLAPVRMNYKYKGVNYILNLIDTPGHVDFSYEVSRSLSACEGIILVVDATQGIQAQTVAHMQLIRDKSLKVIPVINKIDLPTARIKQVENSLVKIFGFSQDEILKISAKDGTNIHKLLEKIIAVVPAPKGRKNKPFKALVFSSVYDMHKGVIVYIKIEEGVVDLRHFSSSGKNIDEKKLRFIASGKVISPVEIGVFSPKMQKVDSLSAGEVGYLATGLKDLGLARVGDTLAQDKKDITPLPGYREPKSMVFLCIFPTDSQDFPLLREALEKLHLSDSSFTYKPFSSPALGKGYQCGFLGLLHAEVVQERLEDEYDLSLITSSPTVEYQIILKNKHKISINTPEDFPEPTKIDQILEPIMWMTIYTPKDTVGSVMQLTEEKRGTFHNLEYIENQAKLTYTIPLSEMIIDFYDILKSVSSGYASLDYEFYEYSKVDAIRLDVLINKRKVEAFSQIVVRQKVREIGLKLVEKLKDLIPKHQFQIPVQAVVGSKVVARSDIRSFRKDVTQKLYGGDRTRKDKLLKKQKKGKKKMRQFGNVNIPQEVFMKVYKRD